MFLVKRPSIQAVYEKSCFLFRTRPDEMDCSIIMFWLVMITVFLAQLVTAQEINTPEISFIGCNLMITDSNNTSQSTFLNSTNGALELIRCFNISIGQSSFRDNQDSAFGGVLEMSASSNY